MLDTPPFPVGYAYDFLRAAELQEAIAGASGLVSVIVPSSILRGVLRLIVVIHVPGYILTRRSRVTSKTSPGIPGTEFQWSVSQLIR